MLWKLLREMPPDNRPTHLAVVFDKSEKTFRTEMYTEYKANRSAAPDDLIPQFPLVREAVRAFDIPCLEQAGFEADDLIATYARLACEAKATCTIVSSDKDLMQLVNDCVTMYDTMKDKRIGRAEVIEKFGVGPEKVIEVQSLIGDSSDNVPGVPGIGVKTAAQLIIEYGDLETLLERAGEIKQEKRRQSLIDHAEEARLSKKLVTLDQHVDLDVPVADLAVHEPDYKNLVAFLKAMEFTTLTRRVVEQSGVDASAIEPNAKLASHEIAITSPPPPAARSAPAPTGDLFPAPARPIRPNGGEGTAEKRRDRQPALTPISLAAARAAKAREQKIDRSKYETVRTLDRLNAWVARANDVGVVAIDTETTSLDPMKAHLCGFSLAVADNEACYVPIGHRDGGTKGGGDLFAPNPQLCPDQIPEDSRARRDQAAAGRSRRAQGRAEPEIRLADLRAARHRHASLRRHHADVLRARRRPRRPRHGRSLRETARPQDHPVRGGRRLRQVAGAVRLRDHREGDGIRRRGRRRDAAAVARAQAADGGASTSPRCTRRWSGRWCRCWRAWRSAASRSTARCCRGCPASSRRSRAGWRTRSTSSPARRSIPAARRCSATSCSARWACPAAPRPRPGNGRPARKVLEELAEQGHELPQKILDWRQVSKLRSTYTDALPGYVNPDTKRVHTSYALAATTTGRLSSSEPNLQNIPIRTEEGRKIRRAFIADDGCKLVSADYSQIELRLLAEVADVPALRKAFKDGLDIHAMTASEMFGVPVKDMPGEIRRRAKAINFGIIYGISAFGLANQLGIEREEAGAYIKKYFERFPGIRAYMDETKAFAKKNGYVLTLFGRKCHYPDIVNSNPSIRAFNERAAINARLQGSAADIIRRAMIRVEPALAKAKLKAQMLLQVHDELIFEVPDGEVAKTLPLVKKVMEDAPMPAVSLHVPLSVDARAADNWEEAH